jgi:hypothetical protein
MRHLLPRGSRLIHPIVSPVPDVDIGSEERDPRRHDVLDYIGFVKNLAISIQVVTAA